MRPTWTRLALLGALLAETLVGVFLWRQSGRVRSEELVRMRTNQSHQSQLAGVARERVALETRARQLAEPARRDSNGSAGGAAPDFAASFDAALQRPEFRKILAQQERSRLDGTYGELFRRLNLDPARLDRLKDLLVDKQLAKSDAALTLTGTDADRPPSSSAFQLKATDEAQAEVDAQISGLLGTRDYAAYEHYEETRPVHAAVNRLTDLLSFTSEPMTAEQADRLTESWYAALPEAQQHDATGLGAAAGAGLAPVSAEMPTPEAGWNAAQSLLSPGQLAILRHLRGMQEAQKQVAAWARAN